MGRSWFYLTLWHGTPPEFTSEFNTQIKDAEQKAASVLIANTADAGISTVVSAAANIVGQELTGADIITSTEVVWYVN